MTIKQHAKFWAIAIIVFIGMLTVLSNILLPFVVGMAVAYFLDPLADKLEEFGAPRSLATSIIIGFFLLVVSIAVMLILPAIIEQVIGLAKNLPGYIQRLDEFLRPLVAQYVDVSALKENENFRGTLNNYLGEAIKKLGVLSGSLLGSGVAFFNVISLWIISPIVAFYLLRDWDKIVARVDSWLPRANAPLIRSLMGQIDSVLAGFVRGQATVCIILATYYGIALMVTGLEFGLVIGIATGLISFIPFVGAIIGFIASVGVASIQFWPDFVQISIIGGIFVVGQIMEGYVLTPNMVGDKVGLHPVWIMFALLAGGSLFGFSGILIAVPVAAIIGVLSRFAIAQYLGSPFFEMGTAAVILDDTDDNPTDSADTENPS